MILERLSGQPFMVKVLYLPAKVGWIATGIKSINSLNPALPFQQAAAGWFRIQETAQISHLLI